MSNTHLKKYAVIRRYDGKEHTTMFDSREDAEQHACDVASRLDTDIYLYEAVSVFECRKEIVETKLDGEDE